MPYRNIIFIKLFVELFDGDDRFLYQLTERQQLLYIKLLYLAGRQQNKISKNPQAIIQKINYQSSPQDLVGDIQRIKKVFHKFKETKYCYTFINFEQLHNQIRIGLAEGLPKGSPRAVPDKDKEEDKEEDKDKEEESKKKKKKFPFEEIWAKYPIRVGKKEALSHFRASVKTEKDWQDINTALKNYLESERVAKERIQDGKTWFNNWRDWLEYQEPICKKCNGTGRYVSSTGYDTICDCPKGQAIKIPEHT